MSTPALTPGQWREWREDGVLRVNGCRIAEKRPYANVTFVNFFGLLDRPDEYRAAIAILLDALAQAGEPLFTDVEIKAVWMIQQAVQSGVFTIEQLRVSDLTTQLMNLLPPGDL